MATRLTIGAFAALLLSGSAAYAASPTTAPVAATATEAPAAAKLATPARPHRTIAPDGAVASLVNVEGLRPGQLVLSGRILADIYAGKITMWDAPQIAHWNPGVALPHAAIVVIRAQDASPTNFAFTSFLASQGELGRGDAAAELTGAIAGQGDAAVASAVQGTRNSIGLPLTKVITRQGVSPVLAAPKTSAALIAARGDMAAAMLAEAPAMAPTLGKLSFIANPPSVLGQLGKSDSAAKSDDNK